MSQPKSSEETGWAIIVAIMIPVIYVAMPGLWIWPVWKLYGATPPDWVLMHVQPLDWLAKSVPAYQSFCDWQAALLGIY